MPRPPVPAPGPSVAERLRRLSARVTRRLTGGGHPIELDYPPPRQGPQRWGWGTPPNAALQRLLADGSPGYASAIRLLRRHGAGLTAIDRGQPSAGEPTFGQTYFAGLDAAALYCFVRERRPARFHEIGSGNSTLFAARAIRDGALDTHILSVDPRPRAEVDAVCDEVVRSPFEDIDPARVAAVEGGDIVLIDSSHHALPNSDVTAFFLDVLPALPAGVLVGVHDVFLPADYPWWMAGKWYSEQYLLASWLLGRGDARGIVLPAHFATTDPALRAKVESAWSDAGLEGVLAYGSAFWFETG